VAAIYAPLPLARLLSSKGGLAAGKKKKKKAATHGAAQAGERKASLPYATPLRRRAALHTFTRVGWTF